jgi:hypothetical protein
LEDAEEWVEEGRHQECRHKVVEAEVDRCHGGELLLLEQCLEVVDVECLDQVDRHQECCKAQVKGHNQWESIPVDRLVLCKVEEVNPTWAH